MPKTGNPASTHTSNWEPLRLLTFYRLVLSGLLTVLYFLLADANPYSVEKPLLFSATLFAYLAFGLLAGFSTRLRWPGFKIQALVQVVADIAAITVLMHASGGITSTLSVLLVVAVGAGGLLLPGRFAFLFAAIATLAMLGESGINVLSWDKPLAGSVTQAGLLGMALFAAAALAHFLSTRLRESEALAEQRGIDLANLEQLNKHIIQHLQSGILVLDPDDQVRMSNSTARKLLGIATEGTRALAGIKAELYEQLQLWQKDHRWQPQNIPALADNSAIIPRFSELTTSQGKGTLVFLDDSATLAEKSQQLKLASLGRLSASIAHEIRNPLGAISHAAQLLEESEQQDKDDIRLIEIIANHSKRVNNIIENVLQLSRRKPVHPKPIHLNNWLEQLTTEFCMAENISRSQVKYSVKPDSLTVQCDPEHLHQVLWNLLQNGIRHAGDPPHITIKAHQQDNTPVIIDIIDNGSGVAADTLDKIFEPFFTTASGGTGLGLYLARELCELNHSQLAYRQDTAGGSCFSIHFSPAAVSGTENL